MLINYHRGRMATYTVKPFPKFSQTGAMLDGYSQRPGLHGPFRLLDGQVYYYDPINECYWDPRNQTFTNAKMVVNLGYLVS